MDRDGDGKEVVVSDINDRDEGAPRLMPNKERPRDRVTLHIGGVDHCVQLETVRRALLEAGWRIEPGSFTARMVREHGHRLIGPAEAAVLDAMAKVPERELNQLCLGTGDTWTELELAAKAELDLREQQPPEKERE